MSLCRAHASGVGPVVRGDKMDAMIDGLGTLSVKVV
jgi:2-keto-4-pentenoate hydratase/2-oxohepta-3-ene-1,7-dioic acid hydratase in catechol pathway